MSTHGKRNVFIALIITAAIAGGLYILGGETEVPVEVSAEVPVSRTPARAFWAQDLQVGPDASHYANTWISTEGTKLSHLHPLSITARSLAFDQYGIMYGTGNDKPFAYDPHTGSLKELPIDIDYARNLIVAPNGRLYGNTAGPSYLFTYDPGANETRYLGHASGDDHNFRDAITLWPLQVGGKMYGYRPYVNPPVLVEYDPISNTATRLDMPLPSWDKEYFSDPVAGEDNLLYGGTHFYDEQARHYRYYVVALDLVHRTTITQEISSSWKFVMVARPAGGVYLAAGRKLWSYDPINLELIELPLPSEMKNLNVEAFARRQDGWFYGVGRSRTDLLFAFQPASGIFREIEKLPSGWAGGLQQIIAAPDDQVYVIWNYQVFSLAQDLHTAAGAIESELIKPTALALTRTVVGGPSVSVQDLACGYDGKVYGVKSQTWSEDWLFWYDPNGATVHQVTPRISRDDDTIGSIRGTVLLPLADGRVVGGTRTGHVFIYNPATQTTWDVGRPTVDTEAITALTSGRDGLIYMGTSDYRQGRMFKLDPVSGVMTEVTISLQTSSGIRALTTGPDGRIYAAAANTLKIYDPANQSLSSIHTSDCDIKSIAAGRDGQIYIGCRNRLLVYKPIGAQLAELAKTSGNVVDLTVTPNGRIYGGIQSDYANRSYWHSESQIFAFDPAVNRMTHLGMAFPTGPIMLAVCDDGALYGGTNTTDSNYIGNAYLYSFRDDCPTSAVGSWDRITWEADTPPNTSLTVDVLNEKGEVLLSQVSNGGSLQSIAAQQHPAIRLRANLLTTDPRVTPTLKRWRVDYTFACQR